MAGNINLSSLFDSLGRKVEEPSEEKVRCLTDITQNCFGGRIHLRSGQIALDNKSYIKKNFLDVEHEYKSDRFSYLTVAQVDLVANRVYVYSQKDLDKGLRLAREYKQVGGDDLFVVLVAEEEKGETRYNRLCIFNSLKEEVKDPFVNIWDKNKPKTNPDVRRS